MARHTIITSSLSNLELRLKKDSLKPNVRTIIEEDPVINFITRSDSDGYIWWGMLINALHRSNEYREKIPEVLFPVSVVTRTLGVDSDYIMNATCANNPLTQENNFYKEYAVSSSHLHVLAGLPSPIIFFPPDSLSRIVIEYQQNPTREAGNKLVKSAERLVKNNIRGFLKRHGFIVSPLVDKETLYQESMMQIIELANNYDPWTAIEFERLASKRIMYKLIDYYRLIDIKSKNDRVFSAKLKKYIAALNNAWL